MHIVGATCCPSHLLLPFGAEGNKELFGERTRARKAENWRMKMFKEILCLLPV
jgi:hypothetical protein